MMKYTNVALVIIPSTLPLNMIPFDSERLGSELSDSTRIQVNETCDKRTHYTIIFPEHEFVKMDPKKLSDQILNLLEEHLPGNEFMFGIMRVGNLSEEALAKARKIEKILCIPTAKPEKPEREEEPEYSDDNNYIVDVLRNLTGNGDDPGPKNKSKGKKKRKRKPEYYRSASWHNCDRAKKMIQRHGVIVASKKDISKDERIIRDFLKEFFPGNSKWKKEFRADVAKRWVQMFVVTKSQLRRLEKASRRQRRSMDNDERVDRTLSFANMLFGAKDHWSDPNR